MTARRVAVLGLVFVFSAVSTGQNKLDLHVKNLMTASEFEAAGLTKLTPAELAKLDAWLNKHTEKVFQLVTAVKAAPASRQSEEAIESNIDGEFHGWDGETIFKLTNGQIWQQAEYSYTYEYAYRPDVTIYKTASCWKMKVEDVSDTICVKRIK